MMKTSGVEEEALVDEARAAEEARSQAQRRIGGAWLKRMRESVGLTQLELVNRLDVGNKSFVSQVELGNRTVPPERYPAWADALKLTHRKFAQHMLFFYEPTIYQMLFKDKAP